MQSCFSSVISFQTKSYSLQVYKPSNYFSTAWEPNFGAKTSDSILSNCMLYSVYILLDLHLWITKKVKKIVLMFLLMLHCEKQQFYATVPEFGIYMAN